MKKPFVMTKNAIIPALIQPYTPEGELDEAASRELVRHLLNQGVEGFYACGSSGEAFLLSIEERKRMAEIVVEEVNGSVPVIVHIGALNTRDSVLLAQHADSIGASAVSAVPPVYYKHGLPQLKQHFTEIASCSSLPLIVYHIPDLTGISPPPSFYYDLSEVEGIIRLKYTAHNLFEMQQVISLCDDDFIVFNGYDEVIISGFAMGAKAGIGSTYNYMPGKYIELRNHFLAGDYAAALRVQYEINEVIVVMAKYNFIAFVREMLRLQGVNTGVSRKPLQHLSLLQQEEIAQALSSISFLNIQQ